MIRRKRTLAKQRNQIYKMYFPESTSPNPYSFIQWLPLSEMRGYVLEQLAYAHGVKVLGGERFAVGNTETVQVSELPPAHRRPSMRWKRA